MMMKQKSAARRFDAHDVRQRCGRGSRPGDSREYAQDRLRGHFLSQWSPARSCGRFIRRHARRRKPRR